MQTKLTKLKRELEEYATKLTLIWLFRNDERPFSQERFKPESTFKTRNKDALIGKYPRSLEERLEFPSKRFNNPPKVGHRAL